MILISLGKVLKNAPIPSEICMNVTNIKLSQNVRNLGVTLDQTLSFNNIFQKSALLAILSSTESAQSVSTSLKMPQKF